MLLSFFGQHQATPKSGPKGFPIIGMDDLLHQTCHMSPQKQGTILTKWNLQIDLPHQFSGICGTSSFHGELTNP